MKETYFSKEEVSKILLAVTGRLLLQEPAAKEKELRRILGEVQRHISQLLEELPKKKFTGEDIKKLLQELERRCPESLSRKFEDSGGDEMMARRSS